MIDIVDRLKFDAARCETTFSKGVAGNIEEGVAEIERLTKERDLALANADAVYAKLMAENERLRAALAGVVRDFVNPYDGGEFERGEIPSLDVARDLLGHQQSTCTRCGGTRLEKATAGNGYHPCPDC